MLGGRPYRSAAQQPTTFQHDAHVMALLRKHAAVFKAVESDGDVLGALLTAEPASFLAAFLVEDGKAWSVEDAGANAAFFNGLTDPESKAALLDAITVLLNDFFVAGGSSSTASPTSSDAPTGRRRRPRRRPALTPSSDTASGPPSSPPSPSPTPSGST